MIDKTAQPMHIIVPQASQAIAATDSRKHDQLMQMDYNDYIHS